MSTDNFWESPAFDTTNLQKNKIPIQLHTYITLYTFSGIDGFIPPMFAFDAQKILTRVLT